MLIVLFASHRLYHQPLVVLCDVMVIIDFNGIGEIIWISKSSATYPISLTVASILLSGIKSLALTMKPGHD